MMVAGQTAKREVFTEQPHEPEIEVSEERNAAIARLNGELSDEQKGLLRMVIVTADVQGDYNWNGEESVYEDDMSRTLHCLSLEFDDKSKSEESPEPKPGYKPPVSLRQE